jgi:hypothetical protein
MLPTYFPPTPAQIRQWLTYAEQGVEARRFAMRTIVYSDNVINKRINFSLKKYDITLQPIEKTPSMVFGGEQKYFPAFVFELISKGPVAERGSIYDLANALDQIMPLMGFDYELKPEYEMWFDYDGSWLPAQTPSGIVRGQWSHSDVPNARIYELVTAFETISTQSDERSKKFSALPKRLKEAASQANFSANLGLLSYYKIIEVIADDVLPPPPLEKRAHSQQEKMKMLLELYPHSFNVDDCAKVSIARNKLAHSYGKCFAMEAHLCKQIALWATEQIAFELLV